MRYRLLRFTGDKSMRLAEADEVRPLCVLMAGYVQDIVRDGGFAEYVILDTDDGKGNFKMDTVYYRVKMSN